MSSGFYNVKRIHREIGDFSDGSTGDALDARSGAGISKTQHGDQIVPSLQCGIIEEESAGGQFEGWEYQLSGRSGSVVESNSSASTAHGHSIGRAGISAISLCKIARAR